MESESLQQPKFVFLTDGGEIRFREDKRYFIFYNPNTPSRPDDGKDRRETIVLMNTLRQLVNYLPEAKRVAKEFTDAVASDDYPEDMKMLEGEIYSQVLSCFAGKDDLPPIRHMLLVSTYNRKSYIWLKRFFQDNEEGGVFKACRGGYWFSVTDDEMGIKAFADRCVNYADELRKRIRKELAAEMEGQSQA